MSRAHKYHAKPTWLDGVRFASQAECRRYVDLRIQERAGHIKNLELQPVFPIEVMAPNGEMVLCGTYRSDFRYVDLPRPGVERVVIEDVKGGPSTPTYRLKKRLVEALHGIRIQEIR